MTDEVDDDDEGGGYGKPPKRHQFKPGQSGHSEGRPPRSRSIEAIRRQVLNEIVAVQEHGVERQITRAQAFIFSLVRDGLKPRSRSRALAQRAAEFAAAQQAAGEPQPIIIIRRVVAPGRLRLPLEELRIARTLGRFGPSARTMLEPWVVERQLSLPGPRRLSLADQATVEKATRTPRKVAWPDWWHQPPFRRRPKRPGKHSADPT